MSHQGEDHGTDHDEPVTADDPSGEVLWDTVDDEEADDGTDDEE